MLKTFVLVVFTIFIAFLLIDNWGKPVLGQVVSKPKRTPLIQLGERIFRDDRFSTPKGDLPASCSHCHLFDEDPQGVRAYTDFFIKSWVSFREKDPRRLMLRNSPTLLDVGEMSRLHYDGEFASLEDLVKGTLAGRPMGWLPGEEAQGFAHARAVVLEDKGEISPTEGTYREQFQKVFGVNAEKLNSEETINLLAKAVAGYCRTLNTRKDSAYDQFIKLNTLEGEPATGESSGDFAKRLLININVLETKSRLKLSRGFDKAALQGLKIFFNPEGGNCTSCHIPPHFTDNSFHNIGVSQLEYDSFHGEGKFAALAIPSAAEARRPSRQYRENPSKAKPHEVDLGFWNFVDLKNSTLRRANESDERFLQRMMATFKTPTLRNLKYTQPYFHNGSLHTLEEVLSTMIDLSGAAQAGRLREADEELGKIKITNADISALVAFLNSLNEDLKQTVQHKR
jgi:cytochrome c peroxidase